MADRSIDAMADVTLRGPDCDDEHVVTIFPLTAGDQIDFVVDTVS